MPRRVGDWLKIAGELRDGFLVIAAICYFFGYIVWAITAYRNDLGLLPALDFQYFVAGVPPLLVLLGLYYIVVGGKWLQNMAQDWLVSPATRGKLFLSLAMVGLAAISFVGNTSIPHTQISGKLEARRPSEARSLTSNGRDSSLRQSKMFSHSA